MDPLASARLPVRPHSPRHWHPSLTCAATAVDDGDDNEEVPPPKKAKAATGKGNKGKKSSVEKQDEDAAEDFDGADAMA